MPRKRSDPFEASDVVKFDASLEQGPKALAAQYRKHEVGMTIMVKGVEHLIVWVDRDKGLAGICKSPRHFIKERLRRRAS